MNNVMTDEAKMISQEQVHQSYLYEIKEWYAQNVSTLSNPQKEYFNYLLKKVDHLTLKFESELSHVSKLIKDRDEAIRGHLKMEMQIKEMINERLVMEKHMKILIHNRDAAFECLREVLKINQDLKRRVDDLEAFRPEAT